MDTYLSWMSLNTPTKWWHDSANPDEINAAIQDGALGVTTNPVLTYRTLKQDGAFWRGEVERLPQSLSPSERAESLLRIIATHAADKLRPVFEATSRAHGYALGQLNPEYAGDGERMYDQALRYISWGSNIAIKLPTTQAALPVIERLAARGTAVCTTLNFTAAQAIAAAEAYERGAARARVAGVEVAPCFVVQQGGRLDEYLLDCARDAGLDIAPDTMRQAGNAVTKRVYDTFREHGYTARLMPAGLHGRAPHALLRRGYGLFAPAARTAHDKRCRPAVRAAHRRPHRPRSCRATPAHTRVCARV